MIHQLLREYSFCIFSVLLRRFFDVVAFFFLALLFFERREKEKFALNFVFSALYVIKCWCTKKGSVYKIWITRSFLGAQKEAPRPHPFNGVLFLYACIV